MLLKILTCWSHVIPDFVSHIDSAFSTLSPSPFSIAAIPYFRQFVRYSYENPRCQLSGTSNLVVEK